MAMRRWQREMLQDAAMKIALNAEDRPPMGVLSADHEAAILEDDQRAQSRVLIEHASMGRLQDLVRDVFGNKHCTHPGELSIRRSFGSSMDDHETHWGQCLDCNAWLVREISYSRPVSECVTDRPMTEREKERLQAYEDRCNGEVS